MKPFIGASVQSFHQTKWKTKPTLPLSAFYLTQYGPRIEQCESCNHDLSYEIEHLHHNFIKFWMNGMLCDHQNIQIHLLHQEVDEVLAEMFNFIRQIIIADLVLIQ